MFETRPTLLKQAVWFYGEKPLIESLKIADYGGGIKNHGGALYVADDKTTSAEFKARREAQADQFRVAAMTERFNALDADKNHQLSRVEFAARPVTGDRNGRRDGRGPGRLRPDLLECPGERSGPPHLSAPEARWGELG
jgi:hypothetical protein